MTLSWKQGQYHTNFGGGNSLRFCDSFHDSWHAGPGVGGVPPSLGWWVARPGMPWVMKRVNKVLPPPKFVWYWPWVVLESPPFWLVERFLIPNTGFSLVYWPPSYWSLIDQMTASCWSLRQIGQLIYIFCVELYMLRATKINPVFILQIRVNFV